MEVTSFNLSEKRNKINKQLLKISGKKSLNATRNKNKVFDKYQHEASYFISDSSFKYNVVVKIAKGKTTNSN